MKKHPGFLLPFNFSPQIGYIPSEGSEYGSLKTKAHLLGSSPVRMKGYPQDEQNRQGREREREREKEREREGERKTRLGVSSRVWQYFIFYCSFNTLS